MTNNQAPSERSRDTSLDGAARLLSLPASNDSNGSLVALEFAEDLPFVPRRFFIVFDVPGADLRGEHAHRECEQVLVCLHGSVTAIVDNGRSRAEFVLNSPDTGLYLPAMTWGAQYDYTPDAVLGVFASLPYDPDDYIRSYREFQQLVPGA